MSHRRSHLPFRIAKKKKILSNLLCWNKNLFHPFGSSLASDIAHWHFTVSQGCRNLSLVLLHCNHLLSHQLKGWKLQAKLKYVLLVSVSRQKPSDECWKATATHLTHKIQNGSLNSRGKAGHLKIELQVFISQTGYKNPHGPFYPYMHQMPPIFSCISLFAKVSCWQEIQMFCREFWTTWRLILRQIA